MHPVQNHICLNQVVHEQHHAMTLIGLHVKVSLPRPPTETTLGTTETDTLAYLCHQHCIQAAWDRYDISPLLLTLPSDQRHTSQHSLPLSSAIHSEHLGQTFQPTSAPNTAFRTQPLPLRNGLGSLSYASHVVGSRAAITAQQAAPQAA